jgi:hypothetical protein
MTIGPVQLVVLGFDDPQFSAGLQAELDRLRDNDLVRLIDGVAIRKDEHGNVALMRDEEVDEQLSGFGAVVSALVGIGNEFGEQAPGGVESLPDAVRGNMTEGMSVPVGDWDVLAEIPEGSAAALLLLEHRWAVPLREATSRAHGQQLASEFVCPLDLVAFGMVSEGEARQLMADESDVL